MAMMEPADMRRMQQEAARRAIETRNRSKLGAPPRPVPEREPPSPPKSIPPSELSTPNTPNTNDIFTVLFQDSEKTLLIILLLLLVSEHANTELVFILMYLIM